jgi:copper chaperone CopZ
MTLASAGSLAPLPSLAGEASQSVTYKVNGFSCATCATGLDAMLSREKGIVSSKSTYPQGIVKVTYLPEKTTEEWISAFIADLGFTVADRSKG